MVMDITDTTNLPKAYGYMPLPWMLGAIVGWALTIHLLTFEAGLTILTLDHSLEDPSPDPQIGSLEYLGDQKS